MGIKRSLMITLRTKGLKEVHPSPEKKTSNLLNVLENHLKMEFKRQIKKFYINFFFFV